MSVSFDASQLDAFAGDLVRATPKVAAGVKGVVTKAAVNVKAELRENMGASPHFHQVARSITFDTNTLSGGFEAKIGPETSGATVGDLAHFAYFGGANGGGGTVPDPMDAAEHEAPAMEKYLLALVDGIV